MRFASLGSGSEGNALLISASSGITETQVMLDCGFGLREAESRLSHLHIDTKKLSGIIVTHEHQDHEIPPPHAYCHRRSSHRRMVVR